MRVCSHTGHSWFGCLGASPAVLRAPYAVLGGIGADHMQGLCPRSACSLGHFVLPAQESGASLAPRAKWGVIPRPPQIMGLEHVSCQGSLRWPQCGQRCGVDGMAARRSPHHDLHATPTGGAPVHGHALVDDMSHGANNLCGNREHSEFLGRLAAPPTSLLTDAVLCHMEDTGLDHLKHPGA